MFNDYKDKLEKLKEDLIYAVEEKYNGELEIEDVANDDSYLTMVLNQDKKVFNSSNELFSNAAAKMLELLEDYIKSFNEYDGRTIFRNRDIVEETLEDFCRTIQILTMSIRKNNATWQVLLNNLIEDKNDEEEVKIDGQDISDDLFTNEFLDFLKRFKKRMGGK